MDRLFARANRSTSVRVAAFLISLSYLLSRLLGLFRDRLLVSRFGIGELADAYTAAFRIPELLFTILVSGAFAVAFIPILTEHWSKGEKEQAWELSSTLLNILMLSTVVAGVAIYIFAEPLTSLITPGFDAFRHQVTVDLTRIMLITPFFFAISTVLGSIQQSFGRFLVFSLASVFYNVGIILGIAFLSPSQSIYGVAYGVVIGAGLQALLQIVGMRGLNFRYQMRLKLTKNAKRVLKLMIPRSIDQGIDQIHYAVETIIGSSLAAGSLAAYYYANNLKNVPLVIFGSAIATAAFPKLAQKAAANDHSGLIEDFVVNLRLVLFLVIPAATVAILMRGYIVRLLFGFGNPATASTLGWFAGAIVFQSIFFLVTRVFYALQDTKTPLYASIVAIGLNIGLSIYLAPRMGVAGLALAQSLVAGIEASALLVILKFKTGAIGAKSIGGGVVKMLLANAIMASVIYIMVARVLPLYLADKGFMVVGPKFFLILAAGAVAYLVPCYVLRLREAKEFVVKISNILRRPVNINT